MTTTTTEAMIPAASSAPANAASDAKGALLARLLGVLDREGLAYCLLHGYDEYPNRVSGDVDMLMPREMLPRGLAELLRTRQQQIGARIVQWFADRQHFIVLQAEDGANPPTLLQLHVSADYEVENRLIYSGDLILRTRRRHPQKGFWIPAAHVEFACVLANRVAKGAIEDRHAAKLAELWTPNPQKCGDEVYRFFERGASIPIVEAGRSGDFTMLRPIIADLRRDFLKMSILRQPLSFVSRWLGSQIRRVGRWAMPRSGMHVVFLGPDGVGKTTVLDGVREQVAPAFLATKYQTFARGLINNKPKASPHALPPRSLPASIVKAGWWLQCYTAGYYASIYPTKARGGLAINHRYMLDAIVDPKRYRYSGPPDLLRWIWRVCPKPDMLLFLDAPPEVIQQRKSELPAEEVTRMRDAYRALAAEQTNARVIDTTQPIDATIAEVTKAILDFSAARCARRFR